MRNNNISGWNYAILKMSYLKKERLEYVKNYKMYNYQIKI